VNKHVRRRKTEGQPVNTVTSHITASTCVPCTTDLFIVISVLISLGRDPLVEVQRRIAIRTGIISLVAISSPSYKVMHCLHMALSGCRKHTQSYWRNKGQAIIQQLDISLIFVWWQHRSLKVTETNEHRRIERANCWECEVLMWLHYGAPPVWRRMFVFRDRKLLREYYRRGNYDRHNRIISSHACVTDLINHWPQSKYSCPALRTETAPTREWGWGWERGYIMRIATIYIPSQMLLKSINPGMQNGCRSDGVWMRNTPTIMVEKHEWKRSLGRPRRRW
jgi:hypothetical protein